MNKYGLQEGNLAVTDFDDGEQIKQWVTGVWGRITHQLKGSGMPFGDGEVMEYARVVLYRQLVGHEYFEKLLPYLP